jgi:hypothetical protein
MLAYSCPIAGWKGSPRTDFQNRTSLVFSENPSMGKMHCHAFFTEFVVQYIAPVAREDAVIDSYGSVVTGDRPPTVGTDVRFGRDPV